MILVSGGDGLVGERILARAGLRLGWRCGLAVICGLVARTASLGIALCLLAAASTAVGVPSAAIARQPNTPVVMVLFDELPITSLLGRSGRIDRIRYPNFAALA